MMMVEIERNDYCIVVSEVRYLLSADIQTFVIVANNKLTCIRNDSTQLLMVHTSH